MCNKSTALANEIEITPEMIEAGERVVERLPLGEYSAGFVAAEAYRAMEGARRERARQGKSRECAR
jgi:hypothetical protein